MKVMMIGLDKAGKTSYMGALYKLFGDEGVGGFSLKARRNEDDVALKRIGQDLENGIYPSGTDIRSVYNFDLCFQGVKFVNFDWSDYRGGMLASLADTHGELQTWENELKESDAVIVFLDSTSFSSRAKGNYGGFDQMDAIGDLIYKVIGYHSEEVFPISFVLTKFDLAPSDLFQSQEMDKFKEVIDVIKQSKNIRGQFTRTIVGSQCLGIMYPFMMVMTHLLAKRIGQVYQQCANKANAANSYANNISLSNSVKSFFKGQTSYAKLTQISLVEAIMLWVKTLLS